MLTSHLYAPGGFTARGNAAAVPGHLVLGAGVGDGPG